ncbi:hypothetical protein JJD26997_1942 [Campylobacter jejuni subsp. doylei 269.97]|uniref:Uncharacterized protein n=1 Tax=Campylobacter jejuni subsp. doylei (strain ATCC BAA-1458 / RM4099 / 269.97) TaxID=360109 RepID=A7H5U0_CAMJD|nr:hypothetical protein JJD26997_1942 [Campylobacter jejuni subsp. doylei 269.97]
MALMPEFCKNQIFRVVNKFYIFKFKQGVFNFLSIAFDPKIIFFFID